MRKEVKRIKLDDEQYRLLKDIFERREEMPIVVAEIVTQMMDIIAKSRAEGFSQASRIAGYKDADDLHRAGHKMSIEWITRELVVREIDDE